jgi:hypothetical protein
METAGTQWEAPPMDTDQTSPDCQAGDALMAGPLVEAFASEFPEAVGSAKARAAPPEG